MMSYRHAFKFRYVRAAAAFLWISVFAGSLGLAPSLSAQEWNDSFVGKRVRIRIPMDRQSLGRDNLSDLERCWEFMNAATGGRLPKGVMVTIHWQNALAAMDASRATVSLGMNDPSSPSNPKSFLLRSAARELARMGLTRLCGGFVREDARFLVEGMSEMLAHDYANTVKKISASWAIAYYLDRMRPLDLQQMSLRPELASATHTLRSAAPGITFLSVLRDRFGRERILKLFESLARKNLDDSLVAVFKTPAAALESEWLARVRGYTPAEITVDTPEEAPALDRIAFDADPAKPGARMGVKIFTRDKNGDFTAAGIYAVDVASRQVLQGVQITAPGERHTKIDIPIESGRQDGRYQLLVVAIDEGGNLRNWEATYSISR